MEKLEESIAQMFSTAPVEELRDRILELTEDTARVRHEKISMYCAAFVAEVGSSEASKYILAETWSLDRMTITWEFRRKS